MRHVALERVEPELDLAGERQRPAAGAEASADLRIGEPLAALDRLDEVVDLRVCAGAIAEGWDPMEWRRVANALAKNLSWSAPLIPVEADPSPYAGSAATG